MATKKYVSLSKLSTFLDNLKDIFALSSHNHKISDITDYTIDSSLSSTSTNPVQNKVLDAEFEAISAAMNALERSIDSKADIDDLSDYETKEDAQVKYDTITDAKADWNQNDEAAIDYVKNRTHWAEQSYEVIVPATTETTGIILSNNRLFSGDGFIVTVDGVEYSCQMYFNTNGNEPSLGDSRLYGDDMSNPVDLPFFAVSYTGSFWGGFGEDQALVDVLYPDSDTHTIEIRELSGESIYHTLDEKFIPDTIARKEYVDTNFALKSEIDNIDLSAYYTKTEIDNLDLITVEDIDAICGDAISYAEDVMF